MSGNRGFIASVFDLSFTEFVTPKIVKILFILAVLFTGIFFVVSAITTVSAGFSGSEASGIVTLFLTLILAPLGFFLYVLLIRMWLEVVIVLFRIAENTGRLVELNRPE